MKFRAVPCSTLVNTLNTTNPTKRQKHDEASERDHPRPPPNHDDPLPNTSVRALVRTAPTRRFSGGVAGRSGDVPVNAMGIYIQAQQRDLSGTSSPTVRRPPSRQKSPFLEQLPFLALSSMSSDGRECGSVFSCYFRVVAARRSCYRRLRHIQILTGRPTALPTGAYPTYPSTC